MKREFSTLRGAVVFGVLMVTAAILSSCDEGWVPICGCDDPPAGYRAPLSPEAVLENLATSYERREIEQYTRCLNPHFTYRVSDDDTPPDLGAEFLTRDEDSTGTAALFASPGVSRIEFDFVSSGPIPVYPYEQAGVMRIRLSPMRLVVHDVSGTTYVATGDIHDLFFVRDEADTTNWSLFDWQAFSGAEPWIYEDPEAVVSYVDLIWLKQHYR